MGEAVARRHDALRADVLQTVGGIAVIDLLGFLRRNFDDLSGIEPHGNKVVLRDASDSP